MRKGYPLHSLALCVREVMSFLILLPASWTMERIESRSLPDWCKRLGGRSSGVAAFTVFAWFGSLGCTSSQEVANAPSHLATVNASRKSAHAITHVTLIDPARGAIEHRDTTIVIRGDRIVSVGPTVSIDIPSDAVVHDASGRFVLPGFWDSHVHLSQAGHEAFPLLVANGITSVRDMGSDFAQVLQWRAARAAGELLPRIITPGPKLDGGSFIWSLLNWRNHEHRILTSPADARRRVDALKAQGVDFIKVHNRLTPALYEALVAECRKEQLPFAGHLPMAGPLAAAAAGQRTIEHGRGMLLCSPDTWAQIRSNPKGQAGQEYCATPAVQSAMFPALLHAGTWFTPTLVSWRGHAMVGDPELTRWIATLPGSSAIWPALRRHWDDMADSTPTAFERQLLGQFGTLAAAASRAGIPLLAGTDLGDPFVIPGFALHDELELMVAGGVTPVAALQSATSEPARAFGLSATIGAIAAGQAADLVLLNGDPLADIKNTRRIYAVVLNGNWLAQ
jgi:imidazolonepropionase-like amidohydrolase